MLYHGIDRAKDMLDQARERAGELGERAGDVASRAAGQIGNAFERAEHRLEEQGGVVSLVREYPLVAAGVAFGLGFLLAGDSDTSRSGITGRAVGQLRKTVFAGITTAVMHELQDLLDEHGGPASLLASLTGAGADSD